MNVKGLSVEMPLAKLDAGKMEGEVSVAGCDGLKTGNKVVE